MLQVYLVRHSETQWDAERRVQDQSDNPLTAKGEQQAMQATTRAKEPGITHITSSDLGRTRRTVEIIVQACGYDITFDSRLRESNIGILETKNIDSLTEEEENWCQQLVSGTVDGRIPEGESMQKSSDRANTTLESCRDLSQGSQPLLVSYGIAPGCLVSTVLGLSAWAERRLCLRNCPTSRVDYQGSLWLASDRVVETAGDTSHLDALALDELQHQRRTEISSSQRRLVGRSPTLASSVGQYRSIP